MSEKKKGFWSWLGFGKKEEAAQDTPQQEETQQTSSMTENSVLEKAVEHLKEKAQQFETFAEKLEEEIEEKLETLEEKIEQSFEEEKAQSVTLVDTNSTSPKAEESQEQAVNFAEEFAKNSENTTAYTQEELPSINHHQQFEAQIEEIVEAELHVEEHHKSAAEEEFEELEELIEFEGESEAHETVSDTQPVEESELKAQDEYQEKPSQGGFFSRLIQGLIKTKQSIGSGFFNFFRGKKIDDELFEELEEQLLIADLGMPTTTKIINNLSQHATKQQLKDADALYQLLKEELADVIKPVARPLEIDTSKKPYVILMVGVNGVGKTTTIGKLARQFQNEGKSVMLAAGDTFRAAAVEQLQVWGERNNIPVIAQTSGSDSASVIFDAMQSASAKNIDVLIADTAGRLQNKNNLMDELKKIVRVMQKYDETAPHEIMLTLDAGTGQNAISQAKLFNEAVGLTGITLTKLDGTAKGGVIFAIADQFNIPIRFIGVGEKIEDLRPFNAEEFIEALFIHDEKDA